MIWGNKKLNIKDLRIKKNGELIAIIPLDNLACAFINDYAKKYKVKIRLRTHDYIDIGCEDNVNNIIDYFYKNQKIKEYKNKIAELRKEIKELNTKYPVIKNIK